MADLLATLPWRCIERDSSKSEINCGYRARAYSQRQFTSINGAGRGAGQKRQKRAPARVVFRCLRGGSWSARS